MTKVRPDRLLFLVVLAMVSLGLIMLYSASSVVAQLKYGSNFFFIARQAGWAVAGFIAPDGHQEPRLPRTEGAEVGFRGHRHRHGDAAAGAGWWIAPATAGCAWASPRSSLPSSPKPALGHFPAYFVTLKADLNQQAEHGDYGRP